MTLAMKSEETRRRILNASVRIFAESGYESATIRQITEKADANISAVNYHFGDKLNLYREVIKDGFGEIHQILKSRCECGTPEQRLDAYLQEMMHVIVDSNLIWHRIIITRELYPQGTRSQVFDLLADLIRPIHAILAAILRDLLEEEEGSPVLELAAELVSSIVSHWMHRHDLIELLSPELELQSLGADKVQSLLYQFTLGGLAQLKHNLKLKDALAPALAN